MLLILLQFIESTKKTRDRPWRPSCIHFALQNEKCLVANLVHQSTASPVCECAAPRRRRADAATAANV
jgi:hypothetical protein